MTSASAADGRFRLDPSTSTWLGEAAEGLDTGGQAPATILPKLAQAGLTRIGVAVELQGGGGSLVDAIAAIAEVSGRSLAAGFVLWGHRTYIEYLLQSPNAALRERLLPDLLSGRIAGATGLSNAMKFLAGLEELQIQARHDGDALVLDGKLPWVTNLRPEGFHVAAAVAGHGAQALIVSLAHDDRGVMRTQDLDLIALCSTNTAAILIAETKIGADRVIADDAVCWLPQVRPAFLGLQCGMSIGLARRALQEAGAAAGAGRHILSPLLDELTGSLDLQVQVLFEGIRTDRFRVDPAKLFRIRIALAEIASKAVELELQACGGRAYLSAPERGFARRWREAAFIPVVTPSLVQLKTMLAAQAASDTAA